MMNCKEDQILKSIKTREDKINFFREQGVYLLLKRL